MLDDMSSTAVRTRCVEITAEGRRCARDAKPGSELCFQHGLADHARCVALNSRGRRCGKTALPGEDRCAWHEQGCLPDHLRCQAWLVSPSRRCRRARFAPDAPPGWPGADCCWAHDPEVRTALRWLGTVRPVQYRDAPGDEPDPWVAPFDAWRAALAAA